MTCLSCTTGQAMWNGTLCLTCSRRNTEHEVLRSRLFREEIGNLRTICSLKQYLHGRGSEQEQHAKVLLNEAISRHESGFEDEISAWTWERFGSAVFHAASVLQKVGIDIFGAINRAWGGG